MTRTDEEIDRITSMVTEHLGDALRGGPRHVESDEDAAARIVSRIMADADGRSGIMDGVESDMIAEIRSAWIAIVAEELRRR